MCPLAAVLLDFSWTNDLTPDCRFCDEIREQGPDSAVLQGETAITKQSQLLARAWKELSEDERKVSNEISLTPP